MTTTMTFEQAIMIISGMNSNFAKSLWQQYSRYGRLSDKQREWVMKLANPTPAPVASVAFVGIDMMPIVALFAKAKEKLARPKLTFIRNGEFRLSYSKDGLWIHVAAPVWGGAYYGKISVADGRWSAGRNCNEDVAAFLKDFASDPAGKAAEYGHASGSCCFCNKRLDNPASTEVGYGPVCAVKWGLPHKYSAVKSTPMVEA